MLRVFCRALYWSTSVTAQSRITGEPTAHPRARGRMSPDLVRWICVHRSCSRAFQLPFYSSGFPTRGIATENHSLLLDWCGAFLACVMGRCSGRFVSVASSRILAFNSLSAHEAIFSD